MPAHPSCTKQLLPPNRVKLTYPAILHRIQANGAVKQTPNPKRKNVLRLAVAILLAAALFPFPQTRATPPSKSWKGKLPITELTEDQAILHALNRLAYGPTPNEIDQVRKIGLEKWIDQQLNPNGIDDSALEARLERYPTLKMSSDKLVEKFPQPQQAAKKEGITKEEYHEMQREKAREAVAKVDPQNPNAAAEEQLAKIVGPQRIVVELSMAKLDRAIYSNRQLEAVMEDFWFNHFNVFAGKNQDRWLLTAYARDTIRPHTLGKFQDLLIATAKSPAMLVYLDNWLSADPLASTRMQSELAVRRRRFEGVFGPSMPPPPGTAVQAGKKKQERGLNENYGREVMELHTLGVDSGYTQQDVIEMAKCMTGWTVHAPRKDPDFFFDDRIHTTGKKVRAAPHFQLRRHERRRRSAENACQQSQHRQIHFDKIGASLRKR